MVGVKIGDRIKREGDIWKVGTVPPNYDPDKIWVTLYQEDGSGKEKVPFEYLREEYGKRKIEILEPE